MRARASIPGSSGSGKPSWSASSAAAARLAAPSRTLWLAQTLRTMQHEFAAVVEVDGDWFVACAFEVAGANGQGRTRDEALASLADAIALILEDRREDGLRGVPADAEQTTVRVAA